jgi:exodeoxyribonuclease V beta subunit
VVTFTDAATKELRERIRARLAEAAGFSAASWKAPTRCCTSCATSIHRSLAALRRRLEIAVQWMDEAAVSTIHGWCQRMLREHAFDSGSLFTQTLETDHSELLGQVMRDYWRRFCYGMRGDAWPGCAATGAAPMPAAAHPALFGRVRSEQHDQDPQH